MAGLGFEPRSCLHPSTVTIWLKGGRPSHLYLKQVTAKFQKWLHEQSTILIIT